MQAMTSELCQSAVYDPTNNGINDSNTVTLTDTRNSQPYMIRKLADNNCWMINNLKLGKSTATTLRNTDTNLPSGVSSFSLPALRTADNGTTEAGYINANVWSTSAHPDGVNINVD